MQPLSIAQRIANVNEEIDDYRAALNAMVAENDPANMPSILKTRAHLRQLSRDLNSLRELETSELEGTTK